MSQLFDSLTALDRKLADRWKIRTRDNVGHILTPADIDFILGDLIRSPRENLVTAVGRRYKKYGVRMIAVEKGEGASEGTKFTELLQQINMVNEIGGIALSLGDFGRKVLKSIPLATRSH
jgi:hypothetical protein